MIVGCTRSFRRVPSKEETTLFSNLIRWGGQLTIVAGMLLAIALLLGLLYQSVSTAIDARRYPPPGRLIEVDGHKMHLECRGPSGTAPTVILNAGLGDSSQVWWSVAPSVAEFAHVCVFDRAGYGWSEYDGGPVTARGENSALHSLLESAGVKPPYVIVGYSLGGTYAYGYARQYPRELAGLVLVDPAMTGIFLVEWAIGAIRVERGTHPPGGSRERPAHRRSVRARGWAGRHRIRLRRHRAGDTCDVAGLSLERQANTRNMSEQLEIHTLHPR